MIPAGIVSIMHTVHVMHFVPVKILVTVWNG